MQRILGHAQVSSILGRSRVAERNPRSDQVGRLGLEPRTYGLKVRCSAIELTPLEPDRPAPSDEAYRLKR
jgi:hypothetical protein